AGSPDGPPASTTLRFLVNVAAVNDDPTGVDDSYSTNEDTTLQVDPPGVLGNDTDPDAGDTKTAVLSAAPAPPQSFILNPDGSFDYVPAADFNGTDEFFYHATDGTDPSAQARVTITVNPVDDAPRPQNDNYSIPEDAFLIVPAPGVLANDQEVDGQTLTI